MSFPPVLYQFTFLSGLDSDCGSLLFDTLDHLITQLIDICFNRVSSLYPVTDAAWSASSATSIRTGYIRVNAKEGIDTGRYYVVTDGNCLLRHPLRCAANYRKLGNVQSGILCQLCIPEPSYG